MLGAGSPAQRGGRFAIGVVVHPTRSVAESVVTLQRWAAAHATDVVARAVDAGRLRAQGLAGLRFADDDSFAEQVDGVVSLGGDGTMLGALRLVASRPVPVLGVNHGTFGFLVEVPPVELDRAMARLVEGRFTVEPRRGLRVERSGVGGQPALDPGLAFNDVVLTRRGRPGGVSLDLEINGERYGYYRCDALVVATPTGSTAYSYSAGGPVLSPSVGATVITPVAPMSGIARSVVFSADDVVTLHVRAEGEAGQPTAAQGAPPRRRADDAADAGAVDVDVDGVGAGRVGGDQAVSVLALADPAQVVRLDTGAHERRARIRLSLLDLPLRRDQLRELVPPDLRRHVEE